MAGVAILVTFILFALAGGTAFWFIPKSQDQILYRTALSLTLVCTWTMYVSSLKPSMMLVLTWLSSYRWAVTYLAQMNPLIVPERSFGHNPTGGHSNL
ncbi:hypothetical protein DFJ77DRAFT_449001 [Powellomyces hirtus]|nr:hypothetical protein DFJ77DRAFT_449001 [Powellomyces hirtus]